MVPVVIIRFDFNSRFHCFGIGSTCEWEFWLWAMNGMDEMTILTSLVRLMDRLFTKEWRKTLIVSINPNRCHHMSLNLIFLPHRLSSQYFITTKTIYGYIKVQTQNFISFSLSFSFSVNSFPFYFLFLVSQNFNAHHQTFGPTWITCECYSSI